MFVSRILIACLLASGLSNNVESFAANLARGKTLYLTTPNRFAIPFNCADAGCHTADPAANVKLNGKGSSAAAITAAINGGVPTMAIYGPVGGVGNLTVTDITDIAAYIGNPVAGAILTASTTTITFPATAFGASTAPTQAITITNTGLTNLSVTSVTGLAAADFGVTHNCTAAVASNANCTITVSLLTGVAGAKSGTLAIASNGGNQNIAVSGTVNGSASVSLNAPSGGLTFPNTTVSASSAATTGNVTLTNSGAAPLSISAFTLPTDFTLDQTPASSCKVGTPVAAGQTCTLSIMFTPGSSGAKSGALSIVHTGTASPATINLSGLGVAPSTPTPAATLTPSTLPSFGNQTIGTASGTKTVTLSNGGTKPLTISNIQDSNGAEFVRTGTCATGAIAIGASCTVMVSFNPVSAGAKAATIAITDDAGNVSTATQRIDLAGTGVAAALPAPTLSVTSVDFGNQDINTASAAKTLTITNSSSTDVLAIASIAIDGANASEYGVDNTTANACTASLSASSSCDVSIKFLPTAAGPRTADLTVTTNATGSPYVVPLSGTGSAVVGPTPTSTPATNVGGGGCTTQARGPVDVSLVALLLLSLLGTADQRRKKLTRRHVIGGNNAVVKFNYPNSI